MACDRDSIVLICCVGDPGIFLSRGDTAQYLKTSTKMAFWALRVLRFFMQFSDISGLFHKNIHFWEKTNPLAFEHSPRAQFQNKFATTILWHPRVYFRYCFFWRLEEYKIMMGCGGGGGSWREGTKWYPVTLVKSGRKIRGNLKKVHGNKKK